MLSLGDCEIEIKLAYDEFQARVGYMVRYWLIYRKYIYENINKSKYIVQEFIVKIKNQVLTPQFTVFIWFL